MKVYKLKLWAISKDDEPSFIDTYIDMDRVDGFYMPLDNDEMDERAINLFFKGDTITVRSEAHIEKYLLSNFVNKAISNNLK